MSPSLPPEDRARLLGPLPQPCLHCDSSQIRHYCRSCDVFFTLCDCLGLDAHEGCRIYRWTERGVLAIPNFDDFGGPDGGPA